MMLNRVIKKSREICLVYRSYLNRGWYSRRTTISNIVSRTRAMKFAYNFENRIRERNGMPLLVKRVRIPRGLKSSPLHKQLRGRIYAKQFVN